MKKVLIIDDDQDVLALLRHTLSREFELTFAENISDGEARVSQNDYDLIVLDEPTAAIDPIEETRVYHQFVEAAAGKTAVIVTHRLGSARIAGRILVMENGLIVEDGTHQDLLVKDGYYARMYAAQASWYHRGAYTCDEY